MYDVASFLVDQFWGDPEKMGDALDVLLRTWNQAFFRFGMFDPCALAETLKSNMGAIEEFSERDIADFVDADRAKIDALFMELLEALEVADGKNAGRRSPVAVVKTLHLLAPEFFPLWDDKIAKGYGCPHRRDPTGAYFKFMKISQVMAEEIRGKFDTGGRTLLKVVDEFNYAKFTKQWI